MDYFFSGKLSPIMGLGKIQDDNAFNFTSDCFIHATNLAQLLSLARVTQFLRSNQRACTYFSQSIQLFQSTKPSPMTYHIFSPHLFRLSANSGFYTSWPWQRTDNTSDVLSLTEMDCYIIYSSLPYKRVFNTIILCNSFIRVIVSMRLTFVTLDCSKTVQRAMPAILLILGIQNAVTICVTRFWLPKKINKECINFCHYS